VHLHLNTPHIWPWLYACVSPIVCPFFISSHPQLGRESQEGEKAHYKGFPKQTVVPCLGLGYKRSWSQSLGGMGDFSDWCWGDVWCVVFSHLIGMWFFLTVGRWLVMPPSVYKSSYELNLTFLVQTSVLNYVWAALLLHRQKPHLKEGSSFL
jgi:hypothetical protein